MPAFKFKIPIQVRYADLDAQWHVNNSRFLTFMEQARFEYLQHLGLFDGKTFMDLRMIIADVHVAYKSPIKLGQKICVSTRTTKIGNKSITFEYVIENSITGEICGTGEVVGVCYNYPTHETVPVPEEWRKKISKFEGQTFE
jgi:YbgC/YbaW family acyl-CoA thioester hydrolase